MRALLPGYACSWGATHDLVATWTPAAWPATGIAPTSGSTPAPPPALSRLMLLQSDNMHRECDMTAVAPPLPGGRPAGALHATPPTPSTPPYPLPGGEARMDFFKQVVAAPTLDATGLAWDWSAFGSGKLWVALFTFL